MRFLYATLEKKNNSVSEIEFSSEKNRDQTKNSVAENGKIPVGSFHSVDYSELSRPSFF